MHAAQMHYSTGYPPNYYAPYPGEVMCYSPPTYPPYFSSKVYQPSHPAHPAAHPQGPPPPGAYRRYPYYQHAGPPPPHELYEQQPPPPPVSSGSVSGPAQQQPPTSSPASVGAAGAGTAGAPSGSQLVPAHQQQHQQQHLEHYPGPPSYYAGYSPGGGASAGQCYTRGLQGPYMEYPPQCPCPMPQSCPKNVHTGPHIGSNIISNIDQSSSCSSSMLLSATSNSNIGGGSSSSSSSSSSTTLPACSSATTTTTASALTTSRGPVKNVTPNNSNSSGHTSTNSCRSSNNSNNSSNSSCQTIEMTSWATAATNTTSTTATTATTGTQCQMLVKTELKGENPQVTKMQYEAHVMPPPTPPESYCASDEKLLDDQEQEAELELRLRLGLGLEKSHGGQQHIEAYDLTCSTPPPVTVPQAAAVPRKARIGKSMAREMVYAAQQQLLPEKQLKQPKEAAAKLEAEPEMPFVLKAEIKAETKIKIEHDGEAQASTHISQLPDLKPTIKTEPEQELEQEAASVPSVAKTEPQPEVEVEREQQEPPVDEEQQPTPGGSKQRFNLLALSSGNKKTKTNNSYKSLIKQAEPKSYLCPGRRFIRRHGRAPAKYVKRRQMILTQRQQQRMRLQRREQQQQRRQQREAAAEVVAGAVVTPSLAGNPIEQAGSEVSIVKDQAPNSSATPSASPKRARPRKQEIAALHLLEGLDTTLSRGYFSDPELNHSSRKQAPTAVGGLYAASSPLTTATDHRGKQTTAEKRSKSETKKPPSGESSESGLPCKKPRKEPAGKVKGKGKKTTAGAAATTIASTAETQTEAVNAITASNQETNNNEYQTADLQAQKFRECPAVTDAKVAGTATSTSTASQQQNQQHSDEQHQFLVPSQPATASATAALAATPPPSRQGQATHTKRTRSRCKFGNRKRQRHRPGGVSYELDVTQPPATKANVVPKWNNGWMWAGKAFQGAVFLNSDDPLVLRTCYPAMRHVEGDIIRIRDCVLLKANEDNELPYVAKVAHLWQNPEDGEMMMSLLWYYRPEHTDQGRQRNDCPDEVYASRHRDHNSVACVEDKCYVLTFSEYCRYRRRLRAAEEDVEDVSIVPRRPSIATAPGFPVRTVPEHTNPELVMFCRRAYEFRTRRLLKLPHKNGLVCSSS
nr:histone gene-specific epigenetic repressor in late S phase, isoform H [Drosophila melanogaster]AFH07486.1 histone gene-specific epigenetic repressor in late S phase, isoform H [Drosophila melanogaster]|eukprot:NP_001245774.1 histone gene-specific epigenetic repressor in late S phase, isoform H [Drosophila melanogaster]